MSAVAACTRGGARVRATGCGRGAPRDVRAQLAVHVCGVVPAGVGHQCVKCKVVRHQGAHAGHKGKNQGCEYHWYKCGNVGNVGKKESQMRCVKNDSREGGLQDPRLQSRRPAAGGLNRSSKESDSLKEGTVCCTARGTTIRPQIYLRGPRHGQKLLAWQGHPLCRPSSPVFFMPLF